MSNVSRVQMKRSNSLVGWGAMGSDLAEREAA